MKDIYKNPVFYYILVPVIATLWPLLLWAVYLPGAEDNWKTEKKLYNDAQKIITEILTIDSDRLDSTDSGTKAAKFDYASVVNEIAGRVKIPASNYRINSKPVRTSGSQKSQLATMVLKDVGITEFAEFLSKIQLRWANLQAESITLTSQKGLINTWKVDLKLKYYY